MRRAMLLASGLLALALLDPAVTAWVERQPGLHLGQHVALALCGLLMALGVRPGRNRPQTPKAGDAQSGS
jgi:hypothetical protein